MDQISEIKQKLNIADIIGSYVELKKSGRNYKAVCPFHAENTPSFMVSAELQIYKCFGCGASGDMFKFIQNIEGIDFGQALEKLADKAGVKLEKNKLDPHTNSKNLIYEINEVATTFYEHLLTKHPAGKGALEYLTKKRALSMETIRDFRLGYAPNSWDLLTSFLLKRGYTEENLEMSGISIKSKRGTFIDKFIDRITFPLITIDNKISGFSARTLSDKPPKYLNTAETLVFHKSLYIYGLDKAKIGIKKRGAVFVEGQLDVISAHQAGFDNIIATSGTSLTTGQLKILSRYTNELIFCFDSDSAGISATTRAIEMAENEDFNIKVAIIPKGTSDIDELIRNDISHARKILEEPISIYDFFVKTASAEFDTKTAYGKKKFIEYLAPKIKGIKSSIVKEHYLNQISDILRTEKTTIEQAVEEESSNFETATTRKPDPMEPQLLHKDKLGEEYLVSLLFHAKIEPAQNILFKLGKKDFTNEENRDIFVQFKDYVNSRKRQFKTKYFIEKLDDSLREKAEELYLWDIGDLTNNETLLEKEIDTTFKRLKRDTINRELKFLQSELKDAELKNDEEKVDELSNKVYKISKLKKKYE